MSQSFKLLILILSLLAIAVSIPSIELTLNDSTISQNTIETPTISHKCVHNQISKLFKPTVALFDEEEKQKYGLNMATYSSEWQSLRIHFETKSIEYLRKYKLGKILLDELIPLANEYLSKRLKVKRLINGITFPKYFRNCHQVQIPQEHMTYGLPESDLSIYVTVSQEPNEGFIAWATPCMLDATNGRPLAGQINFNVAKMHTDMKNFESMVDTTIHELTHVLAFSPSLYDKFIDENEQLRGKNNVLQQLYLRNAYRNVIVSPKVKEVAQKHFNCPYAKGIELENDGSSGSAGAHWERTIMYNEAMTASDYKDASYSNFTLAILEDSGWYKPDYTLAQPFYYGKNTGCDFLSEACTARKHFREFCYEKKTTSCTYHGYSKGICTDETFVGKDDPCFHFFPYGNGDCRNTENSTPQDGILGEEFGTSSRCFVSSAIMNGYKSNVKVNGDPTRCHKYTCKNDGTIDVFVGNSKLTCRNAGDVLPAPYGYTGSIACPNYQIFCSTSYGQCPNYCSGKGYCVNNVCECRPGFTGEDCSQTASGDPSGTGVNIGCPNDCSNNGKCVGKTCVCNNGYIGADCSTKIGISCPNDCSGNGQCNTNTGICKCYYGWSGSSCNLRRGMRTVCKNDCSGNGRCLTYSKLCLCNNGYYGEDCSLQF